MTTKQAKIQQAKNLNTPADVLVALSKDENWWVREGVTRNPNTPANALVALSKNQPSFMT